MTHIKLYDHETVDQLEWPDTEEATAARDFLLPMLKEGVQAYISNVKTQLYLMVVNNQVVPVTVNDKEYDNSYLTSNYFPIKHLEEKLTKKSNPFYRLQTPIIKGVGLLLKRIKINKAVIVNNWLLNTNIYPRLSEQDLHVVTTFLSQRFPDHVLIFRSLDSRKCHELQQQLRKEHYRLIFSRNVYIYDPEKKEELSSKVHYHHRRDRRLIGTEGYEIVSSKQLQTHQMDHLISLYNDLYIGRHTIYSPHYTEKFLKQALEKGFLQLVGLKKEGEIHGVIGFHQRGTTLITPFCGYDQSKGEANHLYRMLTILAIDEAEKRQLVLNDGSGGEAPKQYRGMKPFPEYVALYDRHLPFHRRLFWGVAEKVVKTFMLPKTKN